jgi:hypothetical protein
MTPGLYQIASASNPVINATVTATGVLSFSTTLTPGVAVVATLQ